MHAKDNAAYSPGSSVQAEPLVHASQRVTQHVNDALTLVNYAIETGFPTGEAQPLPQDIIKTIIKTIHMTGAKLGVLDDPDANNGGSERAITVAEWAAFELAYYQLARAMSPVTAETLRNTEVLSDDREGSVDKSRRSFWREVSSFVLGSSPVHRFTRGLWMVTIVFAGFVVFADWHIQSTGQAAKAGLLPLLLPWAYGGLGSCVFLLRSAHSFLYQRTFDLRRKPEYFNRILLGTIAGGAIILFVHQIVDDNQIVDDRETVVEISSAALGFLAGYSTDFLFNTIERIVAAIFPKGAPPDQTSP